jgi:hypothetical protein
MSLLLTSNCRKLSEALEASSSINKDAADSMTEFHSSDEKQYSGSVKRMGSNFANNYRGWALTGIHATSPEASTRYVLNQENVFLNTLTR